MVDRPEVPLAADERAMLEAWLDFHRATLWAKCEGLDPAQLATRAVPPSAISLLGLVRHLADVERHWFTRVMAGERVHSRYTTKEDPGADFAGAAPDNAAASLEALREEQDAARRVQASFDSLDAHARSERAAGFTLRWVLVHMLEEYARHNGHADLVRECVDGTTGV